MANKIDTAFIKQWEAEVFEAFQQRASKCKNAVRQKLGVVGTSTTFQKVGQGSVGTKDRNGLVPVMNTGHSSVECIIGDFYGGEWIDKLDELKTNIDERSVQTNAVSYAMGRKADSLIITAARASLPSGQKIANNYGGSTVGITRGKCLQLINLLNAAEVPDDGERYAFIGSYQWSELHKIVEFASSDYADIRPWMGVGSAVKWLGVYWIMHNGLPLVSTDRFCVAFHKSAVGWAENVGVNLDVTWHGDRQSNFVAGSMTGGAIRIEDTGVVEMACSESAAL